MSEQQRPQLTPGATKELENYKTALGNWVVHEAEGCTLEEERKEITEGDIKKATKRIRKIPTSNRKWVMRIGMGIITAMLLTQIVTFPLLPSIPASLLVPLYLPTVAAIVWIMLFSYIYKEDL